MELGHQGVVVMPIDEGDLYIGILPEMFFEDLSRPDATVTASKYKDALLLCHSYLSFPILRVV
jgi:hypothetical protein